MLRTIFDEFYRINKELNNILQGDNYFGYYNQPKTNIYENESEYILTSKLPGIEKKDISITVKDNSLKISGTVKKEEHKGFNVHLNERHEGNFERNFLLNDKIDASKIEAGLNNGILLIKIPKSPELKPIKVDIK